MKLFHAAALAAAVLAGPSLAATSGEETVTAAYTQAIPNLPGKTLTSVIVSYPPGVKSSSHRHAASAFIYAFVLDGDIRSQVDDAPPASTTPAKASPKRPAPITGSARTPAPRARRACSPCSSPTPATPT